MRILYTVHQFYPKWYTGTEKFVLNSAKMQQRFGNQVQVVSFGLDQPKEYDRTFGNVVYKEFIYQGVPVLEYRHIHKEGHLNEVLVDKDLSEFAKFVIDCYGPDVVHAGHIKRTSEFIQYARNTGIPYVITLTDFWLLCLRTIMVTPHNQICSGCGKGDKCALSCHSSLDYCRVRYKQAKEILEGAYMIVSPSRFLASMFEKEFDDLKVRVINHGMSTLYLHENTRMYEENSPVVFCFAGSITQHKGVHLIVKAFHGLKSEIAKLQIYGSGPHDYERHLRSLAEGDVRIQFRGVYSAGEIASVFDGCDVIIIPSTWYENYPLVLHESLISGVPVLASNIGGMSEKIEDGLNGYTFRVGDVGDLRAKMQDIVDNPTVLNPLKKYLSGYLLPTIEQEASQYLQIYNVRRIKRGTAAPNVTTLTAAAEKIDVEQSNEPVTVVIPTKNAGPEFRDTLNALKAQRGFADISLVVVDSGSTDGTDALAEEYGATIVRIKPEEFSHSYARNLGVSHVNTKLTLLMTQDAVPIADTWLYQMYLPIQRGEGIVAVSCSETPKPYADLYGLACSWEHARFMGVLDQDRILEMPKNSRDYVSVRRDANLNDVACLIVTDVLKQLKYRSSYAENLDLGKRIENGYKMALLGSIKVLHSHNRPSYYYLRRSFVERKAIVQIFPELPSPALTARDFMYGAKTLFALVITVTRGLAALPPLSAPDFISQAKALYGHLYGNTERIGADVEGVTEELLTFMSKIDALYERQTGDKSSDMGLQCLEAFYFGQSAVIFEYLQTHFTLVTSEVNQMVRKALISVAASAIGDALGCVALTQGDDDPFLSSLYVIAEAGV